MQEALSSNNTQFIVKYRPISVVSETYPTKKGTKHFANLIIGFRDVYFFVKSSKCEEFTISLNHLNKIKVVCKNEIEYKFFIKRIFKNKKFFKKNNLTILNLESNEIYFLDNMKNRNANKLYHSLFYSKVKFSYIIKEMDKLLMKKSSHGLEFLNASLSKLLQDLKIDIVILNNIYQLNFQNVETSYFIYPEFKSQNIQIIQHD